jgi:hypothetical protein
MRSDSARMRGFFFIRFDWLPAFPPQQAGVSGSAETIRCVPSQPVSPILVTGGWHVTC